MFFSEIILFIQSMKLVIYAVMCLFAMVGMVVLYELDMNDDDE